jgi:hypothetical protein
MPLCRPIRIEEDNIKMNLGYEDVDWVQLAQDKVQWRHLVNGNEHAGVIRGVEFLLDDDY